MFLKRGGNVTGLDPDYIISCPWLELPVLASWFKQEALFLSVNGGDHPAN